MAHRGRTISDLERARVAPRERRGRTISDLERARVAPRERRGRTISDADRARLLEAYINRNDGGIAKKTRNF